MCEFLIYVRLCTWYFMYVANHKDLRNILAARRLYADAILRMRLVCSLKVGRESSRDVSAIPLSMPHFICVVCLKRVSS
jgi:hypothetical protein